MSKDIYTRKFICTYANCKKAYTLNVSLKTHVRKRHTIQDNCIFVGTVEQNKATVLKYQINEKDAHGRLVRNETDESLDIRNLVPSGILDLHQAEPPAPHFISLNKFGSIILLKAYNALV